MKRRRYRHLRWTDRLRIEQMLRDGKSKRYIADEIGVHLNTIYNELKRGQYIHTNSDWTEEIRYAPEKAEAAYRENLAAKGPDLKIGKDRALASYIEHMIADEKYSPAAVIEEIRKEGLKFETTIKSKTTLYSYIDKGIFLTITNKDLPDKSKRKRRYRKIKKAKRVSAGTSIEKRPEDIANRQTFGNWEMDCVIGKKKTKATLLVLTERKTRLEIILLMKDKTSDSVVKAINGLERKCGKNFSRIFNTITVDNGTEFSDCKGIEKSCLRKGNRTKLYYCHPYSAYERGSNENANRLIRRWLPKGTDFRKIAVKTIKYVENWMNNYPRRLFGCKTAQEMFDEELAAILG